MEATRTSLADGVCTVCICNSFRLHSIAFFICGKKLFKVKTTAVIKDRVFTETLAQNVVGFLMKAGYTSHNRHLMLLIRTPF